MEEREGCKRESAERQGQVGSWWLGHGSFHVCPEAIDFGSCCIHAYLTCGAGSRSDTLGFAEAVDWSLWIEFDNQTDSVTDLKHHDLTFNSTILGKREHCCFAKLCLVVTLNTDGRLKLRFSSGTYTEVSQPKPP